MTINQSLFPWAKLDIRYEMYYSGTWNNVSAYIRQDGPGTFCVITHGRQDEATKPDPAKATFLLDNTGGRFSPRNPRSPLFGLIGRNTPFRVAIVWGASTYYRFHGEISQWPLSWEPSGADNWVTVVASGISRRINRRAQPVTSPIRRLMDARPSVVAYWPLEDSATATQLSSALTNGFAMKKRNTLGSSSLASNDDVYGAAPLPVMDTGYWLGQVRSYTLTTKTQITFVMSASAVPSGDGLGVSWTTSGTAGAWSVVFLATGGIELRAWAGGAGRILTVPLSGVISTTGATGPVNNPIRVSVELTQVIGNINYNVTIYSLNDSDGAHGWSGTLVGYSVGRVREVTLNDPGAPNGSVAYGHVAVLNDIIPVFGGATSFYNADISYNGEFPDVRSRRICEENGIPYDQVYATTGTNATEMGPQPVASISEVFQECMDMGYQIYDDRSAPGLKLMPMEWRLDRNTAILVDYGKLAAGLRPTDDDQGVANDVTVTRALGGSGRAVDTTSPMSTADAPNGIGLYDVSIDLNVYDEDYAAYWAQWLLHFGTNDGSRYPVVKFDLLKDLNQVIIPTIIKELENTFNTGVEVSQVIRITNPPDWLPGGPIELMINGWTERLGPWCWEMEFNCSPAEPWRGWVVEDPATSTYNDDVSRGHVDTAGSETVGSFVAGTGTSLVVKTNSGPRWVTPADQAAAFPFDIMVSGVRLRVTSIAGTSTSGQTFTVAATPVNGVTKTIPSGSAVNILPVYVGV